MTPYGGSAIMDKENQYDWERLESLREKHPVKYHKLILEETPPVIMSSNLYKQHPWVKVIEDYDNTLPTWTRICCWGYGQSIELFHEIKEAEANVHRVLTIEATHHMENENMVHIHAYSQGVEEDKTPRATISIVEAPNLYKVVQKNIGEMLEKFTSETHAAANAYLAARVTEATS
jgi:hypothetical protein